MAYNTIKIKKYADIIEEYTATAVAITPGMLLELASASTVQAHSTAGGNAFPMFALEDEMQGDGIDDAISASAKVQCWIPGRGDIVYALVLDGNSIAVGDFVESGADGYVQKHVADDAESSDATVTVYPNQIIGQAIEAVNMSNSSTVDPSNRIQIRII